MPFTNLRTSLDAILSSEHTTIAALEKIDSGSFVYHDHTESQLPPFLRVAVEMTPGKQSFIRGEVWMPDHWNGILIGLGNSGLGLAPEYPALAHYLRKNYAVIQNDLGTSRHEEADGQNPDMWLDYGFRATHWMAIVGKMIVKTYYGKTHTYAYFIGGSSGGRQALCEAQRFPEDYDGIVAFKAVNNRLCVQTYRLWNALHLTPREGGLFTQEEAQLVTDCAIAFIGDTAHHFVPVPWKDEQTIETFLALLKKAYPFTEEQIHALKTVYTGPVNPKTGAQIYCGLPLGSEIYGGGLVRSSISEFDFYLFKWAFGKDFDLRSFDFADDLDALQDKFAKDIDSNNPDLRPFASHGGKLLVYSGSADPSVPHQDSIHYFNRVMNVCGGYEKTAAFFRYFLVPDNAHCGQGVGSNDCWGDKDGASLIDAVRRWREEGIAPDTVAAMRVGKGEPEFICDVPAYDGSWIAGKDYGPCCSDRYLDH